MRRIHTVTTDWGSRVAATGYSAGTLRKTASYAITELNMQESGGDLTVIVTSAAAAVDITLPLAQFYAGAKITLMKPAGNINAVSFKAQGTNTIEGSASAKRFQNATNELGSCTIFSDATNWRVRSFRGTWVINNV